MKNPQISIILPCLNEEKGLPACLDEIQNVIIGNSLDAEVIISDNNSDDTSREIIVKRMETFPELKLVIEKRRGYGSAYLRGLNEAQGEYIFMADADGTYNFTDIPRFIEKLEEGNDLVLGNRFSGQMTKDAMPWHHRYIGNPILSFLVRILWKSKARDIHCGARAMRRSAFEKITLYTSGMEFASEMVIKFIRGNFSIAEIPIAYNPRIGDSKLESFSDGWRHLRFILLYSPLTTFLLPGIVFFIAGLALMIALYVADPVILGVPLLVHPLFLAAALIPLGYQLIIFAIFAKTYAITHLGDRSPKLEKMFTYITLETGAGVGILCAFAGIFVYAFIFYKWAHSGFGSLDEIQNSVIALTLIILGIQTLASAFMVSILGIKEK